MKYGMMFDFETMSSDSTKCAAIDVSVLVFSWDKFISDKPYTIADVKAAKRFKLSVKDQVTNYDFEVKKDTLQFWSEQSSEVRGKIAPKKDDLTVSEFCTQFLAYLNKAPKIDHWWSRSNTFDPIILTRLFKSEDMLVQLEKKLHYGKVRDTRTWIDAKFGFPKDNGFCPFPDQDGEWKKVFKAHDSSWDVLADVLRLQAIARAEADLEQVKL